MCSRCVTMCSFGVTSFCRCLNRFLRLGICRFLPCFSHAFRRSTFRTRHRPYLRKIIDRFRLLFQPVHTHQKLQRVPDQFFVLVQCQCQFRVKIRLQPVEVQLAAAGKAQQQHFQIDHHAGIPVRHSPQFFHCLVLKEMFL